MPQINAPRWAARSVPGTLAGLLAVVAALAPATLAAEPKPASPDDSAATISHEYRPVLDPRPWNFPRDHGAHPDYQTEWWYYTGHLRSSDGKRFGYEVVFFRRGPDPLDDPAGEWAGWRAASFYPAHIALTEITDGRFHHEQRIRRDLGGVAGADTAGLHVWCGDWSAVERGGAHHLSARAADWSLELQLTPDKPPVRHGREGVSQKGPEPGQASYYYSIPRMTTRGTLTQAGRARSVSGQSWMDHEFFSAGLDTTLTGWDWFSLQLDDGSELMLYRLRARTGAVGDRLSGTYVPAAGAPVPLGPNDFLVEPGDRWTSPRTGAVYPASWRVIVPRLDLSLSIRPTVADQELDTRGTTGVVYWEGSVGVSGARGTRALAGVGYVELTGYDGRVPMEE